MAKGVFRSLRKGLARLVEGPAHLVYHVLVVVCSAAFAISLPFTATFVARKALAYWSFVGNESVFTVSIEITSAILLILLLNHARRCWRDRKVAGMARTAGLILVAPNAGLLARRRVRRLKERHGFGRDVMVIAATGFKTFVDEKGELNQVLRNCREAKVMLLHPESEGARVRARSIVTESPLEVFDGQIRLSIEYLKDLRSKQQNIRLKLYHDAPFLKMAILGDYLWVQYYHPGMPARDMPKYVFRHNQDRDGLFVPFHQYFLQRWHDGRFPEYDLEKDELIYRNEAGNEVRREPFVSLEMEPLFNTGQPGR